MATLGDLAVVDVLALLPDRIREVGRHRVEPRAARQRVQLAVAREDRVGGAAAGDRVGADAAVERAADVAEDAQRVAALHAAEAPRRSRREGQRGVADLERVGAAAADQPLDGVEVVALARLSVVGRGRLRGDPQRHRGAALRVVRGVGAGTAVEQVGGWPRVRRLERVAAVAALDPGGAASVHREPVVAVAAAQVVVARKVLEAVLDLGAGPELVVAGPTVDQVASAAAPEDVVAAATVDEPVDVGVEGQVVGTSPSLAVITAAPVRAQRTLGSSSWQPGPARNAAGAMPLLLKPLLATTSVSASR